MSNKNIQLICLNGPPQSGKTYFANTFAELVCKQYNDKKVCHNVAIHTVNFSDPLYNIVETVLSEMGVENIDQLMTPEHKRTANIVGNGITLTDILIMISEKVIKPAFGDTKLGRVCAKRILEIYCHSHEEKLVFIVDGCGFQDEFDEMVRYLPNADIQLVRMHRVDKNFDNDSRSYIVNSIDDDELIVNSDEDYLRIQANKLIDKLGLTNDLYD